MPKLPSLFLVVFGLSVTSCVSYWRGQEMTADILAAQGQAEQRQEDQRAKNAAIEAQLSEIAAKLEALDKRNTEAINRLRQSMADYGIELVQLREDIKGTIGSLAEIKHKQRGAAPDDGLPRPDGSAAATSLPTDEPELYRHGWESKKSGALDEAIRAFAAYARKFPRADHADNAIYLLADCLRTKKDYTASIRALRTILQNYRKGDKVDDAYVLMHDNFMSLNRCEDALPFLETLLADFPRSNRASESRKKLAVTKRRCKKGKRGKK